MVHRVFLHGGERVQELLLTEPGKGKDAKGIFLNMLLLSNLTGSWAQYDDLYTSFLGTGDLRRKEAKNQSQQAPFCSSPSLDVAKQALFHFAIRPAKNIKQLKKPPLESLEWLPHVLKLSISRSRYSRHVSLPLSIHLSPHPFIPHLPSIGLGRALHTSKYPHLLSGTLSSWFIHSPFRQNSDSFTYSRSTYIIIHLHWRFPFTSNSGWMLLVSNFFFLN